MVFCFAKKNVVVVQLAAAFFSLKGVQILFVQELARIELMESKNIDLKKAGERLRASNQEREKDEYANGVNCGKSWIAKDATATELRRLEQMRDFLGSHWDTCFEKSPQSVFSASEAIGGVILGHSEPIRVAGDFWETVCDEKHPDAQFVKGFVEASLEIWDAVSDDFQQPGLKKRGTLLLLRAAFFLFAQRHRKRFNY